MLDAIKLAERKNDAAAVATLNKKLFDHQIAGNRPYKVRLHEMRQVDSVRPIFDAARSAGEMWLEEHSWDRSNRERGANGVQYRSLPWASGGDGVGIGGMVGNGAELVIDSEDVNTDDAVPALAPYAHVLPNTPVCEVISQDFAGNLDTPMNHRGACYYLRRFDTRLYGVLGRSDQTSSMFFYNERIAGKGPDNVISAEFHHHRHFTSGARRLVKWQDRCCGQCNNNTTIRYLCYITDPHSEYYMYDGISEKYMSSGHS